MTRAAGSTPAPGAASPSSPRFRRPAPPRGVLARPRLLDVLDESSRRRLTLLAAAAGYGKSVVLSVWAERRAATGPVEWLTLRRADDDGVRLARLLVEAMRRLSPGSSAGSHPDGAAPHPGGDDADQVMDVALGIAEHLAGPAVLVLDDVQEVAGSPVAMAVLNRLLREASPHLHVVMASRVDPPLALSRLQLAGELVVLRHRELAFTTDEIAELLAGEGLDLGGEDAATVEAVTEGWPAGVRMVALMLRATPDASSTISGFALHDRALTDYLTGEVLASLDVRLRQFVLRATVGDEVCGALVDAVTGGTDGEAMLAECERRNLFLTHTYDDERGRWYSWHQVFAAHMQLTARFEDPEGVRVAHLAAAAWLRRRDPLAAAHHALQAPDLQLAADVLAEGWLDLTLAGHGDRVLALLRQVPEESGHLAEFELARCLVELQSGDVDDALSAMRRAEAAAGGLDAAQRHRFDVRAAMVRLFLVNDELAQLQAVERGRQLLRQLRTGSWVPDTATAALASLCVGMGEVRLQQDIPGAIAHLHDSQRLAEQSGLTVIDLMARSEQCIVLISTGDIDVMEAQAHDVIATAVQHGWPRLGSLAVASGVLGWLDYWRGDLDAALANFARARGWLARTDWGLTGLEVYFRSRVDVARGDIDAVERDLADMTRLAASGLMPPYWPSLVDALRAEARLLVGDVPGALAVVQGSDTVTTYRLASCTRADVLRLAGRTAEALAELDAIPGSERFPQVEALAGVIGALTRAAAGRDDLAHIDLERALVAASPHRLVQPFLERAGEVEPLLQEHLRRGTSVPELVARLLDRIAQPVQQARLGRHEALTPRELTMLRYLSTPLTHGEIAAEQFVSVNTVKTHVAKVYRKLGVSSRRDAVRRAQELGLLGAGVRQATGSSLAR